MLCVLEYKLKSCRNGYCVKTITLYKELIEKFNKEFFTSRTLKVFSEIQAIHFSSKKKKKNVLKEISDICCKYAVTYQRYLINYNHSLSEGETAQPQIFISNLAIVFFVHVQCLRSEWDNGSLLGGCLWVRLGTHTYTRTHVHTQLSTCILWPLTSRSGTDATCLSVKVNISQWIRLGKALLVRSCIVKAK